MGIPRAEHPRPQFRRAQWMSLNGIWEFEIDHSLSGRQRLLPEADALADHITVPFCPESELSGIGHTDFLACVWYRRLLTLPDSWQGREVRLHFGAVDFECRAWVNGEEVGRHSGGASSFCFDITPQLRPGSENVLVVEARDEPRSGVQPLGKQSTQLHSHGCHYTRTTGIWQSVWLEAVPSQSIERVRIVPDLDSGRLILTPVFRHSRRGLAFRVSLLSSEGGAQILATSQAPAVDGASLAVKVPEPKPWTLEDPHLYGLRFELLDGEEVLDKVESYAGLRKFHIEGNRFYLNNEPIFLRLVLDQGFYPTGVWTAPADEDLRGDIERAQAVGFNGARLHQKVFEERFHYWADRLGYLTWGEFCDWGVDFSSAEALSNHQRDWSAILQRDANHPSIVAWTPFNETAGGARAHFDAHQQALAATIDLTRALDPTRPVHDTSGYVHVEGSDIFTVHDYEQDPTVFAATYAGLSPDRCEEASVCFSDLSAPYRGQPYVVDEYGGTWWSDKVKDGTDRGQSWGYGQRPGDIEEVYRRIHELTAVLTGHPHIAGYCYTQLTDVEQEENGIYTFDRHLKFDAARLRQVFGAPAAIES